MNLAFFAQERDGLVNLVQLEAGKLYQESNKGVAPAAIRLDERPATTGGRGHA